MKHWQFVLIIISPFILIIGLTSLFIYVDTDFGFGAFLQKNMTIKAESHTGHVVDTETGKPIEGAAVYMVWYTTRDFNPFEKLFFRGIDSYIERKIIGDTLVFTDANGNYKAPSEKLSLRVHWRMPKPDVDCVIYKKGYVGYNNKIGFNGNDRYAINNDNNYFMKSNNNVQLRHWQDHFSNYQHISYLQAIINPDTSTYKHYYEIIAGKVYKYGEKKY